MVEGMPYRHHPDREARDRCIRVLYESGMSVRQIAAGLTCSPSTVGEVVNAQSKAKGNERRLERYHEKARGRYGEGELVPITGQYTFTDTEGRSGGEIHSLVAGDRFPRSRPGYDWALARTARGE